MGAQVYSGCKCLRQVCEFKFWSLKVMSAKRAVVLTVFMLFAMLAAVVGIGASSGGESSVSSADIYGISSRR